MNAQQTIDRLMGVRRAAPAVSDALNEPTQFVDNVNTQLIDAMLVLQASFARGAPAGLTVEQACERMATIHELVLCAWEGRRPVDQAAEIVAQLKAGAIISDAMKGPRS